MKNLTKYLMSIMTFVFFSLANFQLQAQVKVTEESKDFAYDAPSSLLVGTWLMDSGSKYIFKANGTMEKKMVSVIKDGVRGILTIYYDKWWKKKDEIFYQTKTGEEGVKWEIDPAYKTAYSNLSNRKKDEFNSWMSKIAREHMSATFYHILSANLLYISQDYMVLDFKNGNIVTFKRRND